MMTRAARTVALASPMSGQWIELHLLDPRSMVSDLYSVSHGDADRESVWDYMAYGPFPSEALMGEWLLGCAGSLEPIFFGVRSCRTGSWIGMCSYLNIEFEHDRLEIGHIWYGAAFHRTEVQTEVSLLMLKRAFDELSCRRVEWRCNAANVASRRAAERMGFTEEGLFRQHSMPKGHNRDTAIYALLDHEWPATRGAFDRWLETAPEARGSLRELITAARNG